MQLRQVVHLFVLTVSMLCGLAGLHSTDSDPNSHAASATSHLHGDAEILAVSWISPELADGAAHRSESGAITAIDGSTEESCPAYATVAAAQAGSAIDSAKARPLADAVTRDAQPSVTAEVPTARQTWGLRMADLAVQRI